MTKPATSHMAREIAAAPAVFAAAAAQRNVTGFDPQGFAALRAYYTIARGSSDAAANIIAYELMRVLGKPATTLPPSVFSLGSGVAMADMAALVISQSGASDDLVRSARGIRAAGGMVAAITNAPGSPVEAEAHATFAIGAGPELAVPATKSVIGALGAGMALLSCLSDDYAQKAGLAVRGYLAADHAHPQTSALCAALLRNPHVYVIGREAGFGAAQEVALKIKETCAIHAEAYSSSEVLHGPLQLVTRPLLVLILDTEDARVQPSLDTAEARFRQAGGTVYRIRPSDVGGADLTPIAAAGLLLQLLYPVVLSVALALGHDPDHPSTLSKVTQTT